ncbi:MAG TPA: hypothetical protein VF297_01600 [Pyrinomonadaceae bacterium]
MENLHEWCFAWKASPSDAGSVERAALPQKSKWERRGMEITVSFLDDDHGLRDKVKRYAREWTNDGVPGMANLHLTFRTDTNNTSIRISFKRRGNSSAVGTTCLKITDLAQPTMNFGNLKADSTDQVVRRAVLHEFGHALGLIHEHQTPAGGINWNEPVVYRDLMRPPNGWTRQQVKENMFDAYNKDETNYTVFDPQSIMIYPIPARWTTDSFSVDWNTELSAQDRKFIAEQYP